MIRAAALALLLGALPNALPAQEYVTAPGVLTDKDFFRAAACAAPPGGECQKPFVRWDTSHPIRIALRGIDPAYIGRRAKVAAAAFTLGVRALNKAGAIAGFHLAKVRPTDRAEIELWFLGLPRGAPIAGTGVEGVDGARLGGATTRVLFNHDTGFIERAVIVFSTSLSTAEFQPVMLEELTQALGLMTDIKSPAYDGVSVLAQDSNAAKALGLQDIVALKRLYARTGP